MSPWELGLHLAVTTGLGAIFVTLVLNLRVFGKPVPPSGAEGTGARVSVLIPARDEEHRIGPCLESLRAQASAEVEIVVLDDHSTDRTAAVAEGLGFSETGDRLRLVRGRDLPEGWTGKGWACHQLAQQARGEWLLFADADTVHAPGSVVALVNYARATGADLLSAWPRQIMGSWSERLVIPLIALLILGFLPQWLLVLAQRSPFLARLLGPRAASLGAANGQCLLFRRAAYDRIGGHAAVRDHLVEDVALGRRVAARTAEGMRLVNCDGSDWVRCRMYENFAGVWEGFTKNLRPAFEGRPALFVLSLVIQFVCLILPFFLVVVHPSAWAAAECVAVFAIRSLLALRGGMPVWIGLLHPFAHLLALGIAMNSWRQCLGAGVTWKGRRYRPSGG